MVFITAGVYSYITHYIYIYIYTVMYIATLAALSQGNSLYPNTLVYFDIM